MSNITEMLDAAGRGDPLATRQLLPLVYDELRRLAARKMAQEAPGQTLSPTSLVHEAYLRLVGDDPERSWKNRVHFFSAAAEAIRRILIENARRKRSVKHGGGFSRSDLDPAFIAAPETEEFLLALDEALETLAARDPMKAQVVKLRYFSGLTIPQVADVLGMSTATVERYWAYARAWLRVELAHDPNGDDGSERR